ncbi:MAG: dienelactone hydrolase family protein [Terriglobia bacterium]
MLAWLLLAFSLSGATASAAPAVKTETVRYASGPEMVKGFLALPQTAGPHPALVVIHEWWGLNGWVKEQAQDFARHGYVALAVDLYRGQSTSDPAVAHELARGVPHDRAMRDLEAAFQFLALRSDVEKDKIGSVGWCMGGGYSIELAVAEPRLAACVVNYGALPASQEDLARIHAPVLGNFGAEDHGIPPAAVHAFEGAMKGLHKRVNVKVYPGAGHAFENPNNKTGYRPAAATDARARTLDFLRQTLRS